MGNNSKKSVCHHVVSKYEMKARLVALFTTLVLVIFPAITFAQSPCPGIQVKILDIKNSTGVIACGLFKTSEGFPTEFLHSATNIIMTKVQDTQARCDFINIPKGTYSLAVIHDENMDGKLGTNMLGVPTEGYGFSNTTIDEFGAPVFSAARFNYDEQTLNLTIKLKY